MISRFDGETFQREADCSYRHGQSTYALGSYRGAPFITGGSYPDKNNKTEIYDYDNDQWIENADYPFHSQ